MFIHRLSWINIVPVKQIHTYLLIYSHSSIGELISLISGWITMTPLWLYNKIQFYWRWQTPPCVTFVSTNNGMKTEQNNHFQTTRLKRQQHRQITCWTGLSFSRLLSSLMNIISFRIRWQCHTGWSSMVMFLSLEKRGRKDVLRVRVKASHRFQRVM